MPMDLGYDMSQPTSGPSDMPSKMYPNLHLEWPTDYDLPDSGTMTVKFVKTGENKSGPPGKKRFTVDLEIKSIESVKKGKVAKDDEKEESGSEALDRHAKDVVENSDDEY